MTWSRDENRGRQSVMFDLMLGDVVAPLERVAPSERSFADFAADQRREAADERAVIRDAYAAGLSTDRGVTETG